MSALLRACLGTALLISFGGCATTGAQTPGDPLERLNRGTYRFNDAVDRAVLKPVAKGYQRHVPQIIRTGISNVLTHLAFPTTIVNDLLQLKLKDTAVDLGRFVLNSTLGLGGLLDPASHVGLARNDEDFGQTLGRWGVPPGPYLVLPLLGPSTLRDAPAMAVDGQTDLRAQLDLETDERVAIAVLSVVDGRASLLSLDQSIQRAFDPYAFVRNAWLQRREYKVRDGDVPDEEPPLDEEFDEPADAGSQPADAVASSSSDTSLMPASAETPDGRLR
ncbi:MAG TPA: VacJ family lipoprotein [Steroidobacteraceae bacterium]|nr:VacJ family lipoprotein [Steroidobacteraceae bacterium]